MAASGWSCSECGTSDVDLRYPSGKMARCKNCQRYYNLTVNSKRQRKLVRTPALKISKRQFLEWARQSARECHYCHVSEAELVELGLKSQVGHAVQALGIDRVDPNRDYELDNIVFCCFACNKAKGNVFSVEEMGLIGETIGQLWEARLRHDA